MTNLKFVGHEISALTHDLSKKNKKFFQLKRHNQVEIIKNYLFLFWLLNTSIICEHVQRLELRKSLKFWAAVAT